jgi:hypothetical protein
MIQLFSHANPLSALASKDKYHLWLQSTTFLEGFELERSISAVGNTECAMREVDPANAESVCDFRKGAFPRFDVALQVSHPSLEGLGTARGDDKQLWLHFSTIFDISVGVLAGLPAPGFLGDTIF